MKNSFSKNVLTLMVGSVIAQAIPISIIPILTRIFTPADFGLLSLYSAITSILGVMATGRYELAIMLPEDDEDARVLLQVSVLVTACFSLFLFVLIFLWGVNFSRFLGNEEIAEWMYLIPFSVLLMGSYTALTYWYNRKQKFKNTAIARVNQSISQCVAQVFLGGINVPGSLVLGQFAGSIGGVFYFLRKDRVYRELFFDVKINKLKNKIMAYKKFPKYGVLGSLCDVGSQRMPIFMLTRFYSSSVTGMFGLTFRVLNLPTSLISAAVSQVLFQKIVEISRTKPERLTAYVIKVFFILFFSFLPLVPIFFMWGEEMFSFVFGEEWREAGAYAGYLVIAVAIRFSVSPLSAVLGLEKNIRNGFFWQVLYFCTIVPTLYLASHFSVEQFFLIFVIHEVVLYSIYLWIIIKSSMQFSNDIEVISKG